MGEVVNLNRARKARDKAEARRAAEANRLTFGRTKAERQTTQKEREVRMQQLRPVTKFERKGLAKERAIADLAYRRVI